ncbi:MAG: hypothetical protein IPI57_02190 [Candidatus Competibacteraceae bacterium]|nr:hypothetical protein [Candidatus Competibacteraceae bacterium]
MSQLSDPDDEMPAEIDFSKGQRGQFFRPGTKLNLPVYLDAPLQARLAALAEARGVEFSIFINELLKKDLELIEGGAKECRARYPLRAFGLAARLNSAVGCAGSHADRTRSGHR